MRVFSVKTQHYYSTNQLLHVLATLPVATTTTNPGIQKEVNNTVAILIGDLGPITLLLSSIYILRIGQIMATKL